jgi:subtilase family serine protease
MQNKTVVPAIVLLLAGCASDIGGSVAEAPAQAVSTRATLTGNVPPWATSASFKGPASATDWVNFRVYLSWSNRSQVLALAQAVSDPANPQYGKYLTPQQFRQQFAPPQANVGAVQSWLTSQGFTIDYVPQNNHYVAAEGTVAQAAAAFGVTFDLYQVDGLTLRSPSSAPSVPSNLGGIVASVVGLDQSAALIHTNIAREPNAPPQALFITPQPCSHYWGEKAATGFPNPYDASTLNYAMCGYTTAQLRSAYGIPAALDGSGQTVAIIDAYASPTIQQDLDSWSAARGIPSTKITQVVAPATYKHPESTKQDPASWYGEESLDVEAVHGMAPGAKIVYVGSSNGNRDIDTALNYAIDQGLAQIITNSWGLVSEKVSQGALTAHEDSFLQAAVQGIGIYFSSGDDSDESQTAHVNYATVDWPASSPWVTAVGGTSLAVDANGNYLFEYGWGTSRSAWDTTCSSVLAWCPTPPGTWLYGSGGGVSTLFPEPAYQNAVVGTAVFAQQGRVGRAVPDVSVVGDVSTGFLMGQTQTFPDGSVGYSEYRIGGTSVSSPVFAGIMALADQAKGMRHGFANPALYALDASAFHDVVAPASNVAVVRSDYVDGATAASGMLYSLRTFNQTLSLQAGPGWDDVTGRGSPTAAFLPALSH